MIHSYNTSNKIVTDGACKLYAPLLRVDLGDLTEIILQVSVQNCIEIIKQIYININRKMFRLKVSITL